MQSGYPLPTIAPDPLEQVVRALQSELVGLFQISTVNPHPQGEVIAFSGRLITDAESGYDEIRRRFKSHGYTPMLRRESGQDVVLAMKGLVDRTKTGNPLVNILLLAATILTTLSAGAQLELGRSLFEAIFSGEVLNVLQALLAGAPFAITLLGILGIHEFGHYVAARLHGVRTTLPYFIPMPLGLGTLGAFILIRSPMKNRKALFDIGLAGPYAGLAAALPLLALGLLLSSTAFVDFSVPGRTLDTLGSSVLISFMENYLADIPDGQTVIVHPIFYAAWLGTFLTGINLLPVGQLDGGHAVYALLGRIAHGVALLTFFLLILAGAFLSPNWFIWAFFIMLGGLRHPPPMNDITGVGPVRKVVGLLTVLVFFLIFIPVPF